MKVFSTVAAILALASAEPEPGYYRSSYGYGVAHHPYGGSSYRGRTVYGYPSRVHYHHKREAEADAEPGYGYSAGYYYPRSYSSGYAVHQSHPGYARSYQSVHRAGGHYLHKREAEADAEPGYGYRYGYTGRYYQPRSYSFGYNVHQGHPGYASSSVSVHQAGGHYIHKREAEAEPGYGYHSLGYRYGRGYARATSYVAPTTYGYPSHGYGYGYRSGYYH